MTLQELMEITDKEERLSDFFRLLAEETEELYYDEDYVTDVASMLYHDGAEIYTGELSDNVAQLVELLDKADKREVIFQFTEASVTRGINCVYGEIASHDYREIQESYLGISDNDCACIYTELIKGMTKEEIDRAKDSHYFCVDDEFMYLDLSYDRVSIVLDEDKLIDHLVDAA